MRKYILEEAYELAEAIENEGPGECAEELGDLFFMLLFVARMFEEAGAFSLDDALALVEKKMIRRHPHIFGNVKVTNSQEVTANWQAIKAQESKEKGEVHSVLGHLPKALPALQRAFRIGERASRVGFDWEDAEGVWDKIEEEQRELKKAIEAGRKEEVEMELGDLLFSVANLARKLGINPEEALKGTLERFISRFQLMERSLGKAGKDMAGSSSKELEQAWEDVKGLGKI